MGYREGIEEDAFHRVKPKPEEVEEYEREGCLGCRGWSNTALFMDFEVVGSHVKESTECVFLSRLEITRLKFRLYGEEGCIGRGEYVFHCN